MARCEAFRCTRCVEAKVAKQHDSSAVRAYPKVMLQALALWPFSLGYFSFGPAKEK
jgi:hypothetical protein